MRWRNESKRWRKDVDVVKLRRTVRFLDRLIVFLSVTVVLLCTWSVVSWYHLSEYDVKTNNCLTQSAGIVKWCTENGIDAELVYGEVFEDGNWSAHAWVRFYGFYDFESTSWYPCDMGKYKTGFYQRYDASMGRFVNE